MRQTDNQILKIRVVKEPKTAENKPKGQAFPEKCNAVPTASPRASLENGPLQTVSAREVRLFALGTSNVRRNPAADGGLLLEKKQSQEKRSVERLSVVSKADSVISNSSTTAEFSVDPIVNNAVTVEEEVKIPMVAKGLKAARRPRLIVKKDTGAINAPQIIPVPV